MYPLTAIPPRLAVGAARLRLAPHQSLALRGASTPAVASSKKAIRQHHGTKTRLQSALYGLILALKIHFFEPKGSDPLSLKRPRPLESRRTASARMREIHQGTAFGLRLGGHISSSRYLSR